MALAAALCSNAQPRSVAGTRAVFVFDTILFAAVGILLGAVLPNARAAQGAGAILDVVPRRLRLPRRLGPPGRPLLPMGVR